MGRRQPRRDTLLPPHIEGHMFTTYATLRRRYIYASRHATRQLRQSYAGRYAGLPHLRHAA